MSYAIKPHLEGAFKNRNIFSQIKRHFFQFLRETVVLWGGNTADTINHCDLCHASSAPSNTLSQGPLSCGPLWLVLGSNKSYSMSQLLCACVFYFSPWIAESAFLRRGFQRTTKLLLFWVTSFGKESNSKNWWFKNHFVRSQLVTQPWDLLINLISGGLLMLMLIWTFQGLLNIDAPIPLWRHFGDSWHQLRVSEMLWDLRTKPDKKLVFVWKMRAA